MAFKIGDKVACINSDGWHYTDGTNEENRTSAPKYQEVLTVDGVKSRHISLAEYPQIDEFGEREHYESTEFRKIEPAKKKSNSVTKELLEKFKESERELIEYDPKEINIPVKS